MAFPGRQGGFNANDVPDESPVVPAGWYPATIVKGMTKATKAGTGSYLSLMFKIALGEYAGRVVWINLNLDNPNKTAVEIAERELASICRATGVLAPDDPEDLFGIPLRIKVAIRPETATFPAGNDIKGFAECSQEEIDAIEAGGTDAPAEDDFDDDIPF